MTEQLIILNEITKSFYGSDVLSNVSLSINKGESVILFGENGSGKTMLCNIIAGVMSPDSGTLAVGGNRVNLRSIEEAGKYGIKMIFQDCQLIDSLTVAENIFLRCDEMSLAPVSGLNRKKIFANALTVLTEIGSSINPGKLVSELSHPEKKIVEIAKALSSPVKLLIIDEISESFSSSDTDRLMELLRQIAARDITVILVSHHIDDLQALDWRTVIVKDGKIVADAAHFKDLERSYIYVKMAGERHLNRYPKTSRSNKERLFAAHSISNEMHTVQEASLELYKGEIVGIYGMDGSGKSSLIRLLCGIDRLSSGSLEYYGRIIANKRYGNLLSHGVGYLSDRIEKNVFLDLDGATNIIIGKQEKIIRAFTLDKEKIKATCLQYSKNLNIPLSFFEKHMACLSRGTQQKIAIARLLNSDCSLLIMDEPSSYLDTPSKVELYNIMNALARKGKTIVFTSSRIEEIAGMCDRAYIVSKGRLVTEIEPADLDIADILKFVC